MKKIISKSFANGQIRQSNMINKNNHSLQSNLIIRKLELQKELEDIQKKLWRLENAQSC